MMNLLKSLLTVFLLAASLVADAAQSAFAPFPKARDSYWRKRVPQVMRRDYIRLGEEYASKPWRKIPDTVFAEFRTTGNRTNYEDSCFSRRRQLACLVMAEIMEHRGRFMPDICRGLHYFLEQEPWWGIPAHYPKSAPDAAVQTVDLFNAETSSMLAWTIYMLGTEIDSRESGLAERVRCDIERRFLMPTLTEKQGWMRNANNWNTWITSNFLEAALVCEPSGSAVLGKALATAESCMRLFLKGYPDDGGCEEGVGYWDRAGASLFESLWMVNAAAPSLPPTVGRCALAPAEREKVAAMGSFITTMHVGGLSFVNFSDAQVHNVPNINILFPYGAWLASMDGSGDRWKKGQSGGGNVGSAMMQFAAYVAHSYGYFKTPSALFLQSGNWPTLGRELMLLSMLPTLRRTRAAQPRTLDAYLANSQIMVASTVPTAAGGSSWLVAAKGGTNGESHNHNDVGNFIVYRTVGGKPLPVVVDLGRDTYTSQTFGPRRYELTNNRSLYHNVPLVGGMEQHAGAQYRASGVSHTANDSASVFALDIAGAYPKEAGAERWQRTLTLNRKLNRVEVREDFATNATVGGASDATAGRQEVQITLMCYGCPVMKEQGRVALAESGAVLGYDAAAVDVSWQKVAMDDGIMKTQWHDNVYRLVLTPRSGCTAVDYWLGD